MYIFDKRTEIKSLSGHLADLTVTMLRVYPEAVTKNSFKPGTLPVTGNQQVKLSKLLKMLIHVSTLINKTYRMKDKQGRYQSDRQDYVNALSLMKNIVEYYHVKKTVYEHEIIALIETHYPDGETFTRADIEELTGYSRSHVKQMLRTWQDKSYIVHCGGNRKQGYKYRLA
jgi:hypothetical protein